MDATPILIVGAVILVFLLFSSQIMAAIPGIESWIKNLFGGGNSEGTLALGFTIFFSDGTWSDINQGSFSLLPLSIYSEQKQVSSIEIDVRGKMNNETGAWTSETLLVTDFSYRNVDYTTVDQGKVTLNSTYTINNGGSDWANGTVKNVAQKTLSSSQLAGQLTYPSQGVRLWHMDIIAKINIKVTAGSVQLVLKTAVLTGGIDLESTYTAPLSIMAFTAQTITAPATATLNP